MQIDWLQTCFAKFIDAGIINALELFASNR